MHAYCTVVYKLVMFFYSFYMSDGGYYMYFIWTNIEKKKTIAGNFLNIRLAPLNDTAESDSAGPLAPQGFL